MDTECLAEPARAAYTISNIRRVQGRPVLATFQVEIAGIGTLECELVAKKRGDCFVAGRSVKSAHDNKFHRTFTLDDTLGAAILARLEGTE